VDECKPLMVGVFKAEPLEDDDAGGGGGEGAGAGQKPVSVPAMRVNLRRTE
jgi:hypothetical protein